MQTVKRLKLRLTLSKLVSKKFDSGRVDRGEAQTMYSRFSRRVTARGYSTSLVTVGPTKL